MNPAGSWLHALALAALQTAAALGAIGLALTAGTVSVFAPLLAALAASCLFAPLTRRPWDRPAIQQLARRTAALDAGAAVLAVLALAALQPDWLDGAHPVATAVAAFVFTGLTGFTLALCGLNTTAQPWGAFNGEDPA